MVVTEYKVKWWRLGGRKAREAPPTHIFRLLGHPIGEISSALAFFFFFPECLLAVNGGGGGRGDRVCGGACYCGWEWF